jgi:hypothetical protein
MPRKSKVNQRRKQQPQRAKPKSQRSTPSRSFSKLGASVGSAFGPFGRSLGAVAGNLLDRISGRGDYIVQRNSITGSGVAGPPVFGKDGSLRFSHREYLFDVVSAGSSFNLTGYAINPGNRYLFPFLSQIALCFEEYEMLGLIFTFKSDSGNAVSSTNSSLGSVIMATNYDVLDDNFNSKQQMLAYQYSTDCKPSLSAIHAVECQPKSNVLSTMYVRPSSAAPSGSDRRFYDLGNFQIATVGQQAAFTVGELWVSYDILLKKPKIGSPLGDDVSTCHFRITSASNSNPLLTVSRQANYTIDCTCNVSSVVIPRSGRYLIAASWNAAALGWATPMTAGTGATAVLAFDAGANSSVPASNTTAPIATCIGVFDISGSGIVNMPGTFTVTTLASGDLYVTQIPSNVSLSSALQTVSNKFSKPTAQLMLRASEGSDDDEYKEAQVIVPAPRQVAKRFK